jgi:PRTRC genetic system protein A
MTGIAGYMVKKKDGLYGSRGAGYNYILAGNGVWVDAENEFLRARVQAAPVKVRGLADLEPQLFLRNKIPIDYFDRINLIISRNSERQIYEEQFFVITWNKNKEKFDTWYPPQRQAGSKVKYDTTGINYPVVIELHTHGIMPAFFSQTDNEDERGLRIYAVIGRLDRICPEIRLRVGVYGYWQPVRFCDVFDFHDIRDSNWLRDRYDSSLEKDLTDEETEKLQEVLP